MADSDTLSTVASITSGFGVAMLFFRIQRELQMHEREEAIWKPQADCLLVAATLISLLLVIFPLVSLDLQGTVIINLQGAACSASSILLAGYIPSIFAHYRLLFGSERSGPRENPEPTARVLIWITAVLAVALFFAVLISPEVAAT